MRPGSDSLSRSRSFISFFVCRQQVQPLLGCQCGINLRRGAGQQLITDSIDPGVGAIQSAAQVLNLASGQVQLATLIVSLPVGAAEVLRADLPQVAAADTQIVAALLGCSRGLYPQTSRLDRFHCPGQCRGDRRRPDGSATGHATGRCWRRDSLRCASLRQCIGGGEGTAGTAAGKSGEHQQAGEK